VVPDERIRCWRYDVLGLGDVVLSYPAWFPGGNAIHRHLAAMHPGARLKARGLESGGVGLLDDAGLVVARLSRRAAEAWRSRLGGIHEIRLLAMVRRDPTMGEDPEPSVRVAEWEVPVVEVVWEDRESDGESR